MQQSHNFQRLYNNHLLIHQMEKLGKTPEQVAEESGISVGSVNAALAGNLGTLKKLRLLSDALNVNWKFITHIDLRSEDEFRRAVVEAVR